MRPGKQPAACLWPPTIITSSESPYKGRRAILAPEPHNEPHCAVESRPAPLARAVGISAPPLLSDEEHPPEECPPIAQ